MKFMKKNRPDVMIIILLILWGIYAVSYTHLDVYKRQLHRVSR